MRNPTLLIRGAAPETPGFSALGPESFHYLETASTAPAIPAPESTLGSHPCVAYPSLRCIQNGQYQPRRAMIFH
jgi:hypothetical protein